ncbi:MAG: MFS transporter, partial [Bacteroidales bacterium]|nr:MFS transporter [Bacteroidales bacterium]
FFWMAFHQNGQSLSLFARNFVNSDSVAPEVWQFLNPALVILLTPVIMWLFGTSWGRKFSTPRKIALGMGFVALAYLFLVVLCGMIGYPSGTDYLAQDVAERLPKTGAWVLIVTYFFLTVAELFISPLGLSFVSKIAPKHIQGICQGLWLSATAIGNLLIMIGPILFNKLPKLWMCWMVFFIICVIAMAIMFGMLKWLERITAEKK